jgi:hypothetical protein
MAGEISIEQAILLGIIVVIAVAVGWYMYTTFIASVQSGSKISVSQATIDTSGNLMLVVSNAGPAPVAVIIGVYVGNTPCSPKSATGPATISGTKVSVGTDGTATLTYSCQSFSGVSGTTVQGYLVLSTGATFPFTASVT